MTQHEPLLAPLFVPATRSDRFRKAAASGADAIIVDLEDAVAPADKIRARDGLSQLAGLDARAYVRINGNDTPWFDDDLLALRAHGVKLVCVPKAASTSVLDAVCSVLGSDIQILAQIETAEGLLKATGVAGHACVGQLAFGPADFYMDMGCAPSPQLGAHALNTMAVASRAHGIALPLDGPCFSVGSDSPISIECLDAKANGAGGKLCIHPSQVAAVWQAFLPTQDEIAWAHRVADADKGGAAQMVDGKMIDRPIVARAHKLLRLAARVSG